MEDRKDGGPARAASAGWANATSRRYAALSLAFEYLEREAVELLTPPARASQCECVRLIMRMKQWTPVTGNHISRAIYIPPNEFQPTEQFPICRQLTWEAEGDREKARAEEIRHPTIAVQDYEVPLELWSGLDAQLSKLHRKLAPWKYDPSASEAIGSTLIGLAPNTNQARRSSGPRRREQVRSLRGNELLDIVIREGDVPELDTAWLSVWDRLSELCVPEREAVGYEATYLIPPTQFTELLVRAAIAD